MPFEARTNWFCLILTFFFLLMQWDDPLSCMILGGCLTFVASSIFKYGLQNSFLQPKLQLQNQALNAIHEGDLASLKALTNLVPIKTLLSFKP